MENEEVSLIKSDFSKLEQMEGRFLENERAYRSEYKKGTDGEAKRTGKQKASIRTRSKLYVPLTKTTVDIIHALFKTSFMGVRCPIEIQSIGQKSEHDEKLKNALSAAVQKAWATPNHRSGLSKAVLSAISQPIGHCALFYDKARNELRTNYIPPTDLAFDQYARDIFDVEHKSFRYKKSVREIKDLIKSGFYTIKDDGSLFPDNSIGSLRVDMEDIYMRYTDGSGREKWKLKTFCKNILVRTASFSHSPFHSGYCLESLPSICKSQRDNELQMYGTAIPELVREIQTEYNIKRNQKIDITENQIDPMYMIDKQKGGVAESDITERRKFIRIEVANGQTIDSVIKPVAQPGTYGITEEIGMLRSEYEVVTGVNSILTGHTSPSDRRAMGALQTVNAASSMRIESMMQTLQDTMLHGYALHFVQLVWLHTPDEVFIELTEDPNIINIIGTKGKRKPLTFDINVNFGTTIGNETKIAQLNALMQTLIQTGHNNPELIDELVKKIMVLILGETADTDKVQTQPQEEVREPSLEEKEAAAIARGGV